MKNTINNTELHEPFICVIGSKCGVGNTSLQVILATQAVKENKNVLFLTGEYKPKFIIDKFRKTIDLNGSTKLLIKQYCSTDLMGDLKSILIDTNFDLIILDDSSIINRDELIKCVEYIKIKNISLVISTQLNRKYPIESLDVILPRILLYISTYVYTLEIKLKFSFIERLKYLFMFWKIKPNRTLKTIKNKYGDHNLSNDFFLNLEQLKIN